MAGRRDKGKGTGFLGTMSTKRGESRTRKSWRRKRWEEGWPRKCERRIESFCIVSGKSHLKVKGASFEKEVSAGCLARAKGLEMQNSQYFRRNDGSLWEGRALPLSSCLTPLSFPYHFCREFTQDYGKRTKTSGFNWVVSRALVFPERPSIPSSPPCVRIIVWNSTYSALSRFLSV